MPDLSTIPEFYRGALVALGTLFLKAVFDLIVGEIRAGRDESRREDRERTERLRRHLDRWIEDTRKYLALEFEAMRLHVRVGLNIVRPRRADYPYATIGLLETEERVARFRDLEAQIFESPPGGRDPALLARIDLAEDDAAQTLARQQIMSDADEQMTVAGLASPPSATGPLADEFRPPSPPV